MPKPQTRYLSKAIENDLNHKMVLLSGPRQSGKTTLAKSLLSPRDTYLNYDIPKHRQIISKQEFSIESNLIIFDELHKMLKWKNYLKGIYDDFSNKKKILVTGSAKIDTFRKQGDALTGRYFSLRLHPFCPAEVLNNKIAKTPIDATNRILNGGAFPEAFFNPANAARILEERFQTLINEDLRDLSRINSIKQFEILIQVLRDRGCGQLSYSALEKDLSVRIPTIISWIDWLTRLYGIFLVYPWKGASARSLRKEPKFYFYDCAASDNIDSKIENLVATSLLKHCHFNQDTKGARLELFYYRDKEKREVDFILLDKKKPTHLIEVKKSEDALSPSLFYLKQKYPEAKAIQLVYNLNQSKTVKGCEIHPLSTWLCENMLKYSS